MNRLLQGDVGSGKTAVAGVAAELAIRSGYQAASDRPPAEQHLRTLRSWFEERGRRATLLTASVPKREGQGENGARPREIDLLVGTHAIIQEDVDQRLGLVIIDEQHRFGICSAPRSYEGRAPRRAGDDRDAHPAHPRDGALRRPRRLGAERAAAERTPVKAGLPAPAAR